MAASSPPPMTAAELLLVAFRSLSDEEQEEAYRLITRARLVRLAGDKSEAETFLGFLRLVAAEVGTEPTVGDYPRAREALRERGIEIPHLSSVVRYYGSWRRAKEALALSEDTTARRIEERFRTRRVAKVWRYSDETLVETLQRAATEIGRAPLVAEFEHWRERELQVARAKGEDLHLPSPTPYRKRYGSWNEACLVLLGVASQVRFDPTRDR